MINRMLWMPFLSLFHREIRRIWKAVTQTVLAPVFNSALYIFIFGILLGKNINLAEGWNYLSFLIPGVIMMGCLNQAFANTTSSIMQLKYAGELQDLKVAPLTELQILLAFSLSSSLRGMVVGLNIFFIGQVISFFQNGSFLTVEHPFLALLFAFIGTLIFGNLGIVVGFWAKNLEQMAAISGFLMQPLVYLGGVFYSLENLPRFWRALSELNPIVYIVNGLRYAFLDQSDFSIETCFKWSFGLIVFFYVTAYFFVKKSSYVRSV